MRAVVLVDNIACEGLPGEWGLSILIEYGDKTILLDTGASGLFMENAARLGLSVEDVDFAVVSHAHYDHSNGMKNFFACNSKAKFYLREPSAENCYKIEDGEYKYIGLPENILEEFPDRIEFVSGDYELLPGAFLIPHKTAGLKKIGIRENMFRKTRDGWIPDDFAHEQSLVFDTDRGLVIFNSCSHGGAANIINEIKQTFPEKRVYGMIGGFHLFNKTEEEVRALAGKIRETGIEYVCTGHCTEEKAYGILQEELGEKLHQLHVNLVMDF